MTPEEAKRLLGGYATGTLTAEERKELFAAALEDQTLFDALADEEALRELLNDAYYRAELVSALSEETPSLGARLVAWWKRPQALGWAAGVVTIVVSAVTLIQIGPPPPPRDVVLVAKQESESAPPAQIARQMASRQVGPPPAPANEAELREEVAPAGSRGDVIPEAAAEPPAEMAMADAARQEEDRADTAVTTRPPAEEPAEPQAMAFAAPQPTPPPAAIVTERSRRLGVTAVATSQSERRMAQLASGNEGNRSTNYLIERADSEDNWRIVPEGTEFGLSDEVRIEVVASQTGTLALRDLSSNEQVWSGSVVQGNSYRIPLPAPDRPGARRLALRYVMPPGQGGGGGFRMAAPPEQPAESVITLVYESQ